LPTPWVDEPRWLVGQAQCLKETLADPFNANATPLVLAGKRRQR